ncbi:MAG: rhomboid family intramembrane serine protease [Halanaeroarchaeum sp.]
MDALSVGLQVGVPLAVVASFVVVRWLDAGATDWGRRLRSRLVLGVPWGTVTVVVLVVAVYLFVQDGWTHPYDPLHIPFTSWSYFYPVGVLLAPLSHQSLGHITGNLVGTVVLAPVAEYAFAHFPTERGASAFKSWRSNPYVRAFVVFPLGVLGVALLTSLFAWGPIIGFSGVVFAFGGFALVRYPLATVVALSARDLVGTVYAVLRDPIVTGSATPSFGPPWWAGIAIQGHLLGFLLGAVLGAAVVSARRSEERPSAARLWLGGLLVTSSLTLWAVWWYRGTDSYVLYRGPGVVLLLTLSLVLAVAVHARRSELGVGVTRRHLALALLVLPIVTMGFVALPLNATIVSDGQVPGAALQVRGYTVTYAEDVPNRRVGTIDVSAFGESTNVNASGVIVVDPDRTIWTEAISRGSLAYDGERTVRVGGLGWSESVTARRRGWVLAGGGTAYQVALSADGRERWVFATDAKTAGPTIAHQTVSIEPVAGAFYLSVSRGNRTLGTKPIPAVNESATLGNLTLQRLEGRVVAVHDGTRVQVAHEETYE